MLSQEWTMSRNANNIVEKIQSLSSEQLTEVEDFVEFIRLRGQERGCYETPQSNEGVSGLLARS
jgi:hypothetical protein